MRFTVKLYTQSGITIKSYDNHCQGNQYGVYPILLVITIVDHEITLQFVPNVINPILLFLTSCFYA